jgi:hypothetical protein
MRCIALYGAEMWTVRKGDQKYLESFEIWYWRRTEEVSWTDRMKNKELGCYMGSVKKGTFCIQQNEGRLS